MTSRHPMNGKGRIRGPGACRDLLPVQTHPITGSGRMRDPHRMTSRHPMNGKGRIRGPGACRGLLPVQTHPITGSGRMRDPSSYDFPSSDESKGPEPRIRALPGLVVLKLICSLKNC
jgi:hypothetical protein